MFDARDALRKAFDSSKDGIQIIFLNLAGELQLEALKAMKLEPSAGCMLLVLSRSLTGNLAFR